MVKGTSIVKKLKAWKGMITFIGVIVVMTISFNAYFAKSAELQYHKQEFADYKSYQRLDYLDKRIAQLEERHECYEDKCLPPKMNQSVWEEYTKKRTERKRLEKILYPEQKEKK